MLCKQPDRLRQEEHGPTTSPVGAIFLARQPDAPSAGSVVAPLLQERR